MLIWLPVFVSRKGNRTRISICRTVRISIVAIVKPILGKTNLYHVRRKYISLTSRRQAINVLLQSQRSYAQEKLAMNDEMICKMASAPGRLLRYNCHSGMIAAIRTSSTAVNESNLTAVDIPS